MRCKKKETQLLLQDLGRRQDYPLRNFIAKTKQKNLTRTRPRTSLPFCALWKARMGYTEKTVANLRLTSPHRAEL